MSFVEITLFCVEPKGSKSSLVCGELTVSMGLAFLCGLASQRKQKFSLRFCSVTFWLLLY